MKQDAWPARTKHYFHSACWRGDRFELRDRLLGRFIGEMLGRHLRFKEIDADATTASRTSYLKIAVIIGDAGNAKSRERLHITDEPASGCSNHHVLHLVAYRRLHLAYAGVV